jgi:hypothetical protein
MCADNFSMGLWAQVKAAFTPRPAKARAQTFSMRSPSAKMVSVPADEVAFALRVDSRDMDIIGAYGALVERQMESDQTRAHYLRAKGTSDAELERETMLLRCESELPFPKEDIRSALERALAFNPPPPIEQSLRVGLLQLGFYVPDAEVPRYGPDNVAEAMRRLERKAR